VIWVGEGTDIDPSAQIEGPVLIGQNCRIKAGAQIGQDTVIGDNALIEEKACLEKAVLWDSVYVGSGAQLEGCTICNHVTIKDSVTIQEGAVVGDRCHIEASATLRTGVKLWPDKVIEGKATVTESLIWGRQYNANLFRSLGVSGIANIELTPDFATKLGASYGAFLKKGATVVTSRDGHPASRMLMRALLSGLVSVGCNVLDLQDMPLPIARSAMRAENGSGGVNIRLVPDNPRHALIEFYDKQGIYLPKNQERKIETIFFRGDYGRTDMDEVGQIEYAAHAVDQYRQRYFRTLKGAGDVARRDFKIVVDYAFGRMATVLPDLLGRLGCDVIALNAYLDPVRAPKARWSSRRCYTTCRRSCKR
jgi:mannose-1-phosphate guanylyltransferase/phosphomannomutase